MELQGTIRVYFLFECRKSVKHKWVVAKGCNNTLPYRLTDASSVRFNPRNWKNCEHDKQGVALLKQVCLKQLPPSIQECHGKLQIAHLSTLNSGELTPHVSQQVEMLINPFKRRIYDWTVADFRSIAERSEQNAILCLIADHLETRILTRKFPHARVHFVIVPDETEHSSHSECDESSEEWSKNSSRKAKVSAVAEDDGTLSSEQCNAENVQEKSQISKTLSEPISQAMLRALEESDSWSSDSFDVPNKLKEKSAKDQLPPPPPPLLADEVKNSDTVEDDDDSYKVRRSKSNFNSGKHLRLAEIHELQCNMDGWDVSLDLKSDSDNSEEHLPIVDETKNETKKVPELKPVEKCISHPPYYELLLGGNILAISEKHNENVSTANWIYKHFTDTHADQTITLCKIVENQSEKDCRELRKYIHQACEKNQILVVTVRCEFEEGENVAKDATTLLHQYDGHTSQLITHIISQPHITVLFQTCKSFNPVWCRYFNIINSPGSVHFRSANSCMSKQEQQRQIEAQTAANVELIKLSHSGQMTNNFFDAVVLGYSADIGEKNKLCQFIKEACGIDATQQHNRWKERLSQMQEDDACFVPLSARQNAHLAQLAAKHCSNSTQTSSSPAATVISPRESAENRQMGVRGLVPGSPIFKRPMPFCPVATYVHLAAKKSQYYPDSLDGYRMGDPAILKTNFKCPPLV